MNTPEHTLVGLLAYGALVALLRFSGKRTLSKMNAFDLVSVVHRTEGGDVRALHNISGYHRDEHSENG